MGANPPTILFNNNAEFISIGPVVDGYDYSLNPPVISYVADLTITASLYSGRNITNPVTTPGTLVSGWATSGQIVVPYVANGMYMVDVAAANLTPSPLAGAIPYYVLVLDAPVSPSGYQFHRERQLTVQTAQF